MNTANDQEVAIRVRGLCNRFGRHVVHEHLDLDVYRGEILGVVGDSGSGKSVLLRSIAGLRRPSAGQITILGETDGAERSIGVLFQQGALFSSLTVLENVALPLIEIAGLRRRNANQIARVKLALAGLPAHAAELFPADLSGGMIKRAALARALALDPKILFLDEPTAGLDPIGAADFDSLLTTLCEAFHLTVFLITHDLDTLYTACDRVAVLSQKRVLVADRLDVVAAMDDQLDQSLFSWTPGSCRLSLPPLGFQLAIPDGTL